MRIKLILAALLISLSTMAIAQEYPVKPVRIIVPYAAGGGIDVLVREVGANLTKSWKQQIVVDNRPGANTLMGGEACVKATPDGYTFCLLGNVLQLLPTLYKTLPFDPAKDLEPVVNLVEFTSVLVANSSLSVGSLQELIALAKRKPGALNYSTLGVGTVDHMFLKWINREYGIDIAHIPYQGQTPTLIQSVLSGETQLTRIGLVNMIAYIRSGRVKPILVNATQRSPLLPSVPTAVEAGVGGFKDVGWYGLFGPLRMPRQTVAKMQSEVNAVLQVPAFREYLVNQGMSPILGSSEDFARFVKTNRDDLAAVVKSLGVVPE
jgi:tripartite-type tricarboxylate transporter receptor subunit TctC